MHMQIIVLHITIARRLAFPDFPLGVTSLNHAETIGLQQNLVYNLNKYEDFVVEVFRSDALEEETPNSDL